MTDLSRTIHNPPTTDDTRAIASHIAADPTAVETLQGAILGANILTCAVLSFAETAGAGVYHAEIALPAGALVNSVVAFALAGPWDADTALLDIGDIQRGVGAYADSASSAIDLAAGGNVAVTYDPATSISPPDEGMAWTQDLNADSPYTYFAVDQSRTGPGVYYREADVITADLTTTGDGGTTGRTIVIVQGFGVPPVNVTATKS